jgi:hypothetical protein
MASQRRDGKRPAGVADDVVHLLETAWVFSAPGELLRSSKVSIPSKQSLVLVSVAAGVLTMA